MSNEDSSLDFSGLGKVAKAIPASSWDRLVSTACKTFEDFLAPITATTSGIGKYIEAKFARLLDTEKILAAETIRRAQVKINRCSHPPRGNSKPQVIIQVITIAGTQTEESLHELWSNLLAREVLEGDVHPEIPRILERMISSDAHTFVDIAKGSEESKIKCALKSMSEVPDYGRSPFADKKEPELKEHVEYIHKDYPFTYAHLENIGLIYSSGSTWEISPIGIEFLRAVSDPSLEST